MFEGHSGAITWFVGICMKDRLIHLQREEAADR